MYVHDRREFVLNAQGEGGVSDGDFTAKTGSPSVFVLNKQGDSCMYS
jgi:hypothetical protein